MKIGLLTADEPVDCASFPLTCSYLMNSMGFYLQKSSNTHDWPSLLKIERNQVYLFQILKKKIKKKEPTRELENHENENNVLTFVAV